MKEVKLLVFIILLFGYASGQCKNIKYYISKKECYAMNDTLNFSVESFCKKSKFVLFSLEYKDSVERWQEIDNDIFSIIPKGIKIIKLLPQKKQKFSFNLSNIDSILLKGVKRVRFRIVENLYSDDKIEIIETRGVKEFMVQRKQ